MAKINASSIKMLLIVVVMGTLFFSMAPSLVHTFSVGVDTFLDELGNTTLYGSGPAAIAGVIQDNWGYFLAVGALTLILTLVGGIFVMKKR